MHLLEWLVPRLVGPNVGCLCGAPILLVAPPFISSGNCSCGETKVFGAACKARHVELVAFWADQTVPGREGEPTRAALSGCQIPGTAVADPPSIPTECRAQCHDQVAERGALRPSLLLEAPNSDQDQGGLLHPFLRPLSKQDPHPGGYRLPPWAKRGPAQHWRGR